MTFKISTFGILITILCSACSTPQSDQNRKHVSISEGTNMAVAVSDDQEFMILDLQGALYKKDLGSKQAYPITGYFMDARQPDISPDGSMVTFQSFQDGNWHIWTVSSDGAKITQLTTGLYDHREPSYAPDGSRIAYSSDQSGSYDIWSMDEPTGKQTPLTSGDYNDYGPAYSHAGDRIAFIRQTPEQWELNIIMLSTKEIKTIHQSPAKLYAPSWYQNDSMISFTVHNWLDSQLKVLDLSTGTVTQVSEQDEDVFPFRVQHRSDGFYYTSDGTVKKRVNGKTDVIPFEAPLPVNITSYNRKQPKLIDTLSKQVKGIHCPQLSPDASMISFIALGDVWIKKLESNDLIRVTDDAFIQLMPAWHPSKTSLVYASDKGNSPAIWEYDLETLQASRLGSISAMPSGLSVSPDGATIAYTMAFGPRSGRLSLMDYSTGKSKSPRQNFPFSTSAPSWHPDNKRILLSMLQPYSGLYREGIARNIIVDAETGKTTIQRAPPHISFGARTNDAPIIADEGKALLYISQGQLYEAPLDPALNVIGEEVLLYSDLADAPSINAQQDKVLFVTGSQIMLLDRLSGNIDNIPIDLTYKQNSEVQTLIIHAGKVITMDGKILENRDIVIKNHIIDEIVPHQDRGKEVIVIDASDQYVIPGLIDMHAHQGSDLGTSLGYKWLAWGVTSTRDPATYPYDAQNRKEAQINGSILHPRIFYTGSPIDGNRVYYNGTYAQYSKEQINRELQRSKALEYDLIKTYVRLPDSLQRHVVRSAHSAGLPITSHELYPAALMGIDGVEHIMGTSRRGYTPKMSETYRSYADVPAIMAASGMTFTPTISIYSGYNYMLHKHPSLLDDQRIIVLEGDYAKTSAQAGITLVEENRKDYGEMFSRQSDLIDNAHKMGVKVIAGTDSPIIPYGFGLFVELLCYQAAGLEPMEVLKTATVNAADALNVADQIGRIREGSFADLLILDADPTLDIMNLKSIDQVILSGKVLELDELLREYAGGEE